MFWAYPAQLPVNGQVFVAQDGLDDLRLELSYNASANPAIFELQPLSAQHWELCEVLVRISEFNLITQKDSLDQIAIKRLIEEFAPEMQSVLWRASEFLHAVWTKDSDHISEQTARFVAALSGNDLIPARSRHWGQRAAKYVETIVDIALRQYLWPNAYQHSTPHQSYKTWWYKSPTIVQTLKDVAQSYGRIVTAAAPSDVEELRIWLEKIADACLKLCASGDDEEPRSFFCASAYFARIAEHLVMTRRPAVAMMSLHRSAEWLLIGLLADLGKISYTKDARLKKTPDRSSTFRDYLDEVDGQSALSLSSADRMLLLNVNDWRNLLSYTHHMSCPTEPVMTKLLADVLDLLGRVGRSSWRPHHSAFAAVVPIDIGVLLDPGSYIRNGIRLVPVGELRLT